MSDVQSVGTNVESPDQGTDADPHSSQGISTDDKGRAELLGRHLYGEMLVYQDTLLTKKKTIRYGNQGYET
jgi:hypothetical protein